MLMGEYRHSVDPKGRVTVPADLRYSLGTNCVICKGLDGCLYLYGKEEWERFEEELKKLPKAKKDVRNLVRSFLSGAAQADPDSQGRILLSDTLREFAGIGNEAVLVGMIDRVEIWGVDRYEDAQSGVDMDEVAEKLEEYGINL
ncbi:MAG: division/cell wall cluster transcriptional repressor MraZ [Lachnospiraceae bacterium]|nr:division/cell wall cluster transcriptional repressor MraZ [Lachnospiraceae bacterium]